MASRASSIWQRIVLSLLIVLCLAAVLGFAFFRFATHKVANDLRPPILLGTSTPSTDFVFRTLDGQPRRLSTTRGRVVFLDLWGTWCIQCVAEMPTVQKLYDRYRNDPSVEFLIVSRMDSPAAVRAYAKRQHLSLPFYVTHDEDIPDSMYLHQYPATFLYGKDGNIAAEHAGGADWSAPSVIRFIDNLKQR